MTKFIISAALLCSVNAMAEDCSTLEKAKEGLVRQAAQGEYPFSGNYTTETFAKLRSVEEYPGEFCHFNGEDCDTPEIDFGMYWSFEPGARGWIGISKTCTFDYAITFRD